MGRAIPTITERCFMAEEQTLTELVRQAQQGHENSMGKLAREAEGKVYAYVYRLTLDHDLTQELSQEVLLQMVKSLNRLRKAESFGPWLYRIAQNKIRQHYRSRWKETSIFESAAHGDFLSQYSRQNQADGLRQLIRKEWSKKLAAAMRQIRDDHRAVLSLRCFEQLSYSDIGTAMHCSEGSARVMFCRAKQTLRAGFSECLP